MECIQLTIPPLPQFIMVGHSFWPVGMQHDRRRFQVYDMLLIGKGTLYMAEDGREYEIGPGRLLLLEPGKTHWGYRPCDEVTEVYWVHFIHSEPSSRLQSEDIPWSTVLVTGTDRDLSPAQQPLLLPKWTEWDMTTMTPVLRAMLDVQDELKIHNAVRLHALFMEFLTLLQQSAARSVKPSRSRSVSERAAAYLTQYANRPFDAAGLEEALHFQFDYISRCLKRHTGMTPLQYVIHLRMEDAKRLLTRSNLEVGEIAERIGVPDYNYFARLFRQKVGLTPTEYRSRTQGFV